MAYRPPSRNARLVALALFCALAEAGSQTTSSGSTREYLYVENSGSGDVSVIAIPDHRVVGTIPASVVGRSPDDVVVSHDGKVLYVNRLETRDVIAISTATEKELFRIAVGGEPHHMMLSRDGRLLFVPIFTEGVLEVIDLAQRRVTKRISVDPGPHATRLSADGRRLYVGSLLSDHISVIEVASLSVVRQLEFDDGVRPFEVSPDERYVYAQLSRLHGFAVYDLAADSVVRTVGLPALDVPLPRAFPHTVNHGMELTRDGKLLMVAATLGDYVAFYALPDLALLGTVTTGKTPGWLTLSSDERFLYSSNRGAAENTVSVIDVAARREITRIPVGRLPQRMTTAFVPDRPR